MPGYLERYQQGECTQVWNELVALGDQVRTESYYSEARAVAKETMRRAAHNIALLTERLHSIGFEFEYPSEVMTPPSISQRVELETFERKIGPVPLSLSAWVENVGSVNFMGSHPRLSYYAPHVNPFSGLMMGGTTVESLDIGNLFQQLSASDAVPSNVTSVFSRMQGMLHQLTGQDVRGSVPEKAEKSRNDIPEADQVMSDPLVVDLSDLSIDAYEEWQYDNEDDGSYFVTIAPDIFHKSNVSGSDGFEIDLPSAAADMPLRNTEWGELTFVDYLRLSFEWAGFPGLKDYARRDEVLLASLKEGLLPL